MRLLLYISIVVVLTAPLIWAWNPIRKWLGPAQSLGRLLLRIMLVSFGFILYALFSFWLALRIMAFFPA